jgi:hypothetical protein
MLEDSLKSYMNASPWLMWPAPATSPLWTYTPFRMAVCLACLVELPALAGQRFGSATDHSIATSLGLWCAIATRPSVIFSKTRKRTDADGIGLLVKAEESPFLLGLTKQ